MRERVRAGGESVVLDKTEPVQAGARAEVPAEEQAAQEVQCLKPEHRI